MNAMLVIHPYKTEGVWAFDDESVGLVQEPFVSGIDDMIEILVTNIPNAETGFTLIFSGGPFPGFQIKLDWVRPEFGGNWYHSEDLAMEGWLCPAMFKYFDAPPKNLYAQFRPKTA